MENFELFFADTSDVMVEIEALRSEVESLDDETLVEEVAHLIEAFDYSIETESCISGYLCSKVLTERQRKVLEGCYINTYGQFGITEEGTVLLLKVDDFS